MTTIAFCDGIMAADTRAMRGEVILPKHVCKLFCHEAGVVLGGSGVSPFLEEILRIVQEVLSNDKTMIDSEQQMREVLSMVLRKAPKAKEGMTWSFLVYFPFLDRLIEIHSDLEEIYSEQVSPAAIGSGGDYALAAMLAGAGPHVAIEVAMKLDPYTGGSVDVCDTKSMFIERG